MMVEVVNCIFSGTAGVAEDIALVAAEEICSARVCGAVCSLEIICVC